MAVKSIAIAADHAGFALKASLAEELKSTGYEVIDLGTREGTASIDYPDFGKAVAEAVTSCRSEGRRVGEECVGTCRSGLSHYHLKTTTKLYTSPKYNPRPYE